MVFEIQSSFKNIIIDEEVLLIGQRGTRRFRMNSFSFTAEELGEGQYIIVLKIIFLTFSSQKQRSQKLKLNVSVNGKSHKNFISLISPGQKFVYLQTQFSQVSPQYSQLKILNKFPTAFRILSIDHKQLPAPLLLEQNNEHSYIVSGQGQGHISLRYEIVDQHFLREPGLELIYREKQLSLYDSSVIETQILDISKYLSNSEISIDSLCLKNKEPVLLFQQNFFKLSVSYFLAETQNKTLFLEFKWPQQKYLLIGMTRFQIKNEDYQESYELKFLPVESGFAKFPKLMLVEIKEDGSEHQRLLNDSDNQKRFFIEECLRKQAKLKVEKVRTDEI